MKNILKISTLIIGSLLCLHASWLPMKGWLAERLIAYSWHQSISFQHKVKPWPWADTYPIAKISFERLNKQMVVLNGGDPTTLAFSAGAVAPFNQASGTQPFVVAGHRDSHFSFLNEVLMNDIISLADKHGQNQLYQVEAIDIVDASTGELSIWAEDSPLILITCYPFNALGSDSQTQKNERYIITAKRL